LVVGALLGAQQPTTSDGSTALLSATARGSYATRADLEKLVAAGGPQAAAISARLANGDFQIGDRIALIVVGEPTLTDTFTVREGQTLRLPNMPDIELHGVLHSELQATLTTDLAKYLRDPEVRATPLIRLAVVGQVQRPGYYSAPADALLSDMLNRAGGATTTANLNKSVIHRNGTLLLNAGVVSYALANGETIDQLSLLPGDEIIVAAHGTGNVLAIIYVVGALLGILVSITIITRH
jgi:protein involved in polysaccharide export with SLBB domain